jgi:hypothetical protein
MILVKEEFVGGEKWRRAVKLGGSDAIVLWLAMKCYCSQHPDTEGFVPGEEIEALPGAPRGARRKALQALLECGRLLPGGGRGTGLVEPAEGGWKLHDYLDHSASPEELELRRAKAALRKQTYRESKRRELDAVRRLSADLGAPPPLGAGDTAGHVPRDTRGHVPHVEGDIAGDTGGTVSRDGPTGAGPHEGAHGPALTRAGAHPSPTQPSPTQPKKSLRSLASTIRDPRVELGRPVEACAAHRQFAAEHGLDVEPILAELRAAPGTACLSADEIRAQVGALLLSAAEQRQAIGGAA